MTPLPTISPTSVPIYSPLTQRTGAVHHIVVTQSAEAPPEFLAQLHQPVLLAGPDIDDQLKVQLQQASVGTHLYLMGDEAFIWRLHSLAREAGLQADEIGLVVPGIGPRRIYCVHCGRIQHSDEATEHICQGCHVKISVREHFSRRLGAYLAVCEDVDQPYAGARS